MNFLSKTPQSQPDGGWNLQKIGVKLLIRKGTATSEMTEEPKPSPLVEAAHTLSTHVLKQIPPIRSQSATLSEQIELLAIEICRFADRATFCLDDADRRGLISEAVLRAIDCSSALELASHFVAPAETASLRESAELCRYFAKQHTANGSATADSPSNGQATGSDSDDRIAQRMEAARRHREMMADLRRLASGESGMQSPL
jgi:hypothetical protein